MSLLPWIDSLLHRHFKPVAHCRMIIFKSPFKWNRKGRDGRELNKRCFPLRTWKSQQEDSHLFCLQTKSAYQIWWKMGLVWYSQTWPRKWPWEQRVCCKTGPAISSIHQWIRHGRHFRSLLYIAIKTASQRLIKMIYVHGEEHGLPNIDMTDRMQMNLISYYNVTFFSLKENFVYTKIEAMWFCGKRTGFEISQSRFIPSVLLSSCVILNEPPNLFEPQSSHL